MSKDEKPTGNATIKAGIKPMLANGLTVPHLVFKGKAPAKGDKISAMMENGSIYSCEVASVVETDGECIVQPVDGLKLVSK